MSSVDELVLILLAIYFSECPLYLRAGALAVGKWFFRPTAWTADFPIGRSGGALTLLSPLPWETAAVCEAWPVALAGEGLASLAGLPGGAAANGASDTLLWEQVEESHADGRWLYVNDASFAECASEALAEHLAALCKQLRAAEAARRPQIIRKALAATVNLRKARERVSAVAVPLRRLTFTSTLLFFVMFALIPVAHRTWPAWIWAPSIVLLVLLLMLVNRHYLSRILAAVPELTRTQTFKTKLVATVSPLASMRCPQAAVAHLLPLHHPLAVAATYNSAELFRDLAGRVWRELHFPSPPTDETAAARRGRILSDATQALAGALGPLIESQHIRPATLLAPPAAESPDVTAYCPRCQGQFLDPQSRCHSCGDLPVLPLA